MHSIISNLKELILKDGHKLVSNVWFPKGDGPWPTLLMRQPYGKEIASTVTYPHPNWWAANGYFVIIQDVRGQGASTGDFLGFEQEASDTTETLKWARALPECNGSIGMYGFSYQGLTQLLAEPGTPPPNCLAPAMTGLHEGSDWSCEGGAFWWHLGLSWGLQLAAQKQKRNQNEDGWIEIRESLENKSYLRKGPELLKKYDPSGMAMKWFKESNKLIPKWSNYQPTKEWLKTPMLLIGGWWDPHLKGILEIYSQSINSGGNPELHIGPATHLEWWEGVHLTHLNFFEKHLKKESITNALLHRTTIWNLTTMRWYTLNELKGQSIYWNLWSDGTACIDQTNGLLSNKSGGEITLVLDPWRPTPSIGGHLSPDSGYADRASIDQRNDVGTFTTAPFNESLQIEGYPKLHLFGSSDQEGFDLCGAISVVDEKLKKVHQISTGVLRVKGKNARKNENREIIFQPVFADIPKGSKLRLSIAASAWPAIGINPGSKNHLPGAPSSTCAVTTISLELEKAKLEICPLLSN